MDKDNAGPYGSGSTHTGYRGYGGQQPFQSAAGMSGGVPSPSTHLPPPGRIAEAIEQSYRLAEALYTEIAQLEQHLAPILQVADADAAGKPLQPELSPLAGSLSTVNGRLDAALVALRGLQARIDL